jgi:hypothetical protein
MEDGRYRSTGAALAARRLAFGLGGATTGELEGHGGTGKDRRCVARRGEPLTTQL